MRMNLMLSKLFGTKPINSVTIASAIEAATQEREDAQRKLAQTMEGLATFTDAEHVAAQSKADGLQRLIARLAARTEELTEAHAQALLDEAEAERLAARKALERRVTAARKAVDVTAKDLLKQYDDLAAQIVDVIEKLAAIDSEVASVKEALKVSEIPEGGASFGGGITDTHRKRPDRKAFERTAKRPCWVQHDGSGGETVRPATVGPDGEVIPLAGRATFDNGVRYPSPPQLEHREIVVERGFYRPGEIEDPLSSVRLPPGFAGGKWHWPKPRP